MLSLVICTSHQILQGYELWILQCATRVALIGKESNAESLLVVKIEEGNHLGVLSLTGG